MNKFLKDPSYIVFFGLIGVILAPFLFTSDCFKILKDFSGTGGIGDSLAGTTAPIIGLVSIFLIFITYKSQKEEFESSRKAQKEEFESTRKSQKEELDSTREFVKVQTETLQLDQKVNILENLLKETNESISSLEWKGLKGLEAIRNFDGTGIGSYIDYLNAIILRFKMLIVEANKIKETSVRENYLGRIYISFYSKILWTVKSKTFNDREKNGILKNDDSYRLFYIYCLLSLETLYYLEEKKHILLISENKKDVIKDFTDFINELKRDSPEVTNA